MEALPKASICSDASNNRLCWMTLVTDEFMGLFILCVVGIIQAGYIVGSTVIPVMAYVRRHANNAVTYQDDDDEYKPV
jgi:hypothetical protein